MFYCIEGTFNMETVTNAVRKNNSNFLIIVDCMEGADLYISAKCDNKPKPVEDVFCNIHEWDETRFAFKV